MLTAHFNHYLATRINYEKMQLIQGKTVETLLFFFSFFFQLRVHKVQYVLYPTWRSRDPLHLGDTGVPFDFRGVSTCRKNVRDPCEGTISNATIHGRDRVIPRGSTR